MKPNKATLIYLFAIATQACTEKNLDGHEKNLKNAVLLKSLDICISSDKESYAPGEIALISVRAKNVSGEGVIVWL